MNSPSFMGMRLPLSRLKFIMLLAQNTLGKITETPMGDILLAGATGFLGIHILKEFLENYPGKVYCLMRSEDGNSADARLKGRLVYYFETVFHPCNNHNIYMSDVIYTMKEYGFVIKIVSEREFAECLKEKMQDDRMIAALTGILAYQENNPEKPLYGLGRSNEFTTEVLYRLNFKWPMTSEDYIKKTIAALDGLGFFDTQY
jgi:hypothetical protein